jgi:hypothetical protein
VVSLLQASQDPFVVHIWKDGESLCLCSGWEVTVWYLTYMCTWRAMQLLTTFEFHSVPQHMACTYRYWQCCQSPYMSFTVPHRTYHAHIDTNSVATYHVWVPQPPRAHSMHIVI